MQQQFFFSLCVIFVFSFLSRHNHLAPFFPWLSPSVLFHVSALPIVPFFSNNYVLTPTNCMSKLLVIFCTVKFHVAVVLCRLHRSPISTRFFIEKLVNHKQTTTQQKRKSHVHTHNKNFENCVLNFFLRSIIRCQPFSNNQNISFFINPHNS